MFFSRDDYYQKGADWYSKIYFPKSKDFYVRGEATPHYLYWAEKVSNRIRNVYKDKSIKFIIILRDPIQRAYSWYWNMIADGKEELSFVDALKNEEYRIKSNWDKLKYYGSMQYGYFRGGCYTEQIQYFLDDFPKTNFLFLLQEDLIQDQKSASKTIFNFLGIDADTILPPIKSNPASMPRNRVLQKIIKNRSRWKNALKPYIPTAYLFKFKALLLGLNKQRFYYPSMDLEARNHLKEKYSLQTHRLSEIIERDLSQWSK